MKSKRTHIEIVVNPSSFRTLEQVKAAQAKAVRFATNVLEDDDLADELDELTPEEYAERKRLHIVTPNPRKETAMATKSRAELQKELDDVKLENEVLNAKLDKILDLAAVEDDEDEDDDDEDEDDSDDDDSDDEDEEA